MGVSIDLCMESFMWVCMVLFTGAVITIIITVLIRSIHMHYYFFIHPFLSIFTGLFFDIFFVAAIPDPASSPKPDAQRPLHRIRITAVIVS